MSDYGPIENTDRELWRGPDEGNGSFYADSIHVTATGGIGINCGGHVIVKPVRDWHKQAARIEALEADNKRLQSCIDEREEALRTLANPWQNQLGRIEALEAALREITEGSFVTDTAYDAIRIARAALALETDQ